MQENIQKEAVYKLSYGLYILTTKADEKDYGCVINTAMLVTENPYRMLVSVNKNNYTYEMVSKSGVLNVSVLNDNTTFELIKRFGFASGRDTDKFDGYAHTKRSSNGISYITESTNAYLSGKVVETVDVGTHVIFICDITESVKLGDEASLTYADYHKNVKPKSESKKSEKKTYVCSVCGYEYEGEELPEDFVCPWCKHGADSFELK